MLPNGCRLKIYVTAKNEIGAYIEYRIGHGSFTKLQRCLAPGSRKPEPANDSACEMTVRHDRSHGVDARRSRR